MATLIFLCRSDHSDHEDQCLFRRKKQSCCLLWRQGKSYCLRQRWESDVFQRCEIWTSWKRVEVSVDPLLGSSQCSDEVAYRSRNASHRPRGISRLFKAYDNIFFKKIYWLTFLIQLNLFNVVNRKLLFRASSQLGGWTLICHTWELVAFTGSIIFSGLITRHCIGYPSQVSPSPSHRPLSSLI